MADSTLSGKESRAGLEQLGVVTQRAPPGGSAALLVCVTQVALVAPGLAVHLPSPTSRPATEEEGGAEKKHTLGEPKVRR